MTPSSKKAAWLEREPGRLIPAGSAALAGVFLLVAASFIRASAGDANIDTDAELLLQHREHSGTLMLASIVGAIGWLCFAVPLYVLFRAAWARSPRVRGALVAFAFIGPVLLAIQGPVQTVALKDAGDTFAEEQPAATAPAEQSASGSGQDADAPDTEGATTTAKPDEGTARPDESATGKSGEETVTPTAEDEASTTTTTSSDGEDEEDTPEEQRAEDTIEDSGLAQFARALLFPALVGLGFGLVYIDIWALRTGLMTRFWGSLGAAIGVLVVLVPPLGQLATILWFVVLGMLLLGRWPGGRPPAWDAGVAIPWTRPGDEPPEEGPGGSVEGQGREISSDGPTDVQGDPADGDNGSDPRDGGEPPPRKRKRRR